MKKNSKDLKTCMIDYQESSNAFFIDLRRKFSISMKKQKF